MTAAARPEPRLVPDEVVDLEGLASYLHVTIDSDSARRRFTRLANRIPFLTLGDPFGRRWRLEDVRVWCNDRVRDVNREPVGEDYLRC